MHACLVSQVMASVTRNLPSIFITNPPYPHSPPKISSCSRRLLKTSSLSYQYNQADILEEAFAALGQTLPKNRKHLDDAYSSALELCATKNSLPLAQQIHALILKFHHVNDLNFLNTKLVFVYGKTGSLLDAEKVFDEMCERSVYTWNAMIGGYVAYDEPIRALELYKEMRLLDFPVDAHTISSILKACGSVESLDLGREIHGFATKLGFLGSVFVVNSLVGMYAKCFYVDAGVMLFDRLGDKDDTVSWNSIISCYSASGMAIKALRAFRDMCDSGVVPSTYTFVAVLQLCEGSGLGKVGMAIHAMLLKWGYYIDLFVANALLVMYGRTDQVDRADQIFRETEEKDIVTWNSMLSGYVQNGLYNEAINLFSEMMSVGLNPDEIGVMNMISACGRSRNPSSGMQAHGYALKNGMDCDLQVGNSLLDMYAKCGWMDYVNFIFSRMHNKDYVSWTTAIAGFAQSHCYLTALELFRKVVWEGVDVDPLMIGSILLACSGLKCNSLTKEIHGYVMRRGLSDNVLKNSLVNAYGDSGNVHYTQSIFKLIENRDIVSFTSMISCYIINGLAREALDLILDMKEADIELDEVAALCLISAAGDLSALRKGKEVHGFLIRKGFKIHGPVASTLVDMYASCGTIENSCKVFYCTGNKDLVLWTSLINAHGMHGYGETAIDLFRQMQSQNLVPDHVTFLALLHACSHSVLVDEGKSFFKLMQNEYKLEPWPEHYVCLVDMLGRANYLEEAFQFVENMNMEPTTAVWSALLGACRIHSNKKLGDIAAEKLLELEPENPGNHVLVSNVYAEAGRWEEVEEVRLSMKVKGLNKDPACSWIEVGNQIHTFVAHDKSHPESNNIYKRLSQITEELEEGGYVPQTKYVLHNVEEREKIKILYGHSERLCIAFGLLSTSDGTPIRIMKNLRVCGDCHNFIKLSSKLLGRDIIVRDANRFHHFKDGACSCNDIW